MNPWKKGANWDLRGAGAESKKCAAIIDEMEEEAIKLAAQEGAIPMKTGMTPLAFAQGSRGSTFLKNHSE